MLNQKRTVMFQIDQEVEVKNTTTPRIELNPRSNLKGTSEQELQGSVLVFVVLIYILLPWRTSLLFPGKQLFSFGVFLKFSFQILKITRYKIPRFDCKALFINVPNSHNHKGILIALPFLRKVMSIYETWKF